MLSIGLTAMVIQRAWGKQCFGSGSVFDGLVGPDPFS